MTCIKNKIQIYTAETQQDKINNNKIALFW